jgi:hypothetical protein
VRIEASSKTLFIDLIYWQEKDHKFQHNISEKLYFFSAEALRDFLLNNNKEIDFIEFCDDHIRQLKKDNRAATAANHTTVRNSIVDYFGRQKVSILEITAPMLSSYERFLRSIRTIKRINQSIPSSSSVLTLQAD